MDQLKSFRKSLDNLSLTGEEKLEYMDLKCRLLECEQMPISEVVERAFKIKPLIRLTDNIDGNYSTVIGSFNNDDRLCFMRSSDIVQSYLYNFTPRMLSYTRGKPLEANVSKLKKVCEFTCYHRYGGYPAFLRPSVIEVLQQLPENVDIRSVNAFELKFESNQVFDIYDSVIDRHISTVILYSIAGGLPGVIKNQDVIMDTARYRH